MSTDIFEACWKAQTPRGMQETKKKETPKMVNEELDTAPKSFSGTASKHCAVGDFCDNHTNNFNHREIHSMLKTLARYTGPTGMAHKHLKSHGKSTDHLDQIASMAEHLKGQLETSGNYRHEPKYGVNESVETHNDSERKSKLAAAQHDDVGKHAHERDMHASLMQKAALAGDEKTAVVHQKAMLASMASMRQAMAIRKA